MGIAFLSTWVVGPDIQQGKLREVLPGLDRWNDDPAGIFLLRALPSPSAKVLAFSRALIASIGNPPVWEPLP